MVFSITKAQKLNSENCRCHTSIWGRLTQIYKGIHGNINLHFSSSEMKRLQYLYEITSSPLKIRCWRADHSLSLLLTVCLWTPAPHMTLTGFSTKTCFQRKKLKYNNRLIMFTDILKMWGFFQTELILRSNKTQLSSIEINKFMTQVNNCMFIFSEIKC